MKVEKNSVYLRSGGQDLVLEAGNYVIGRSPLANIVIDGPLVSRRHAELRAAGETVILKDLDSANGIFVNGQRIFGSRVLKPGDKFRIGHRELEVGFGAVRAAVVIELSEHSRGHRSVGSERERAALANSMPTSDVGSSEVTRQSGALELAGQVAERALAAGRILEAEQVLSTHLKQVLTRLQSGERVDAPTSKLAVTFGLKLAEVTGNAAWLSYALQVLRALKAICDDALTEQLRAIILRIPQADPEQLSSYARGMRQDFPFNLEHLASAQRLEELAQLARGRAPSTSQR